MVEKAPNCQPLHTEDYGWENHRYESKHFRLAHVERYADGKIEVLHFTTFPHKWSPEPIFGFDVICTGKIVTGAYMDLSPILATYPFDEGIDFRVVVQSNPEDLDANQLVGKIYLKPTRALEFIDIEFLITPTGASFEDI